MQFKLNCNCLTLKILFTYSNSYPLLNHLKISGEEDNIIQNERTFTQAVSSKVYTSILHTLSKTHNKSSNTPFWCNS